MHRSVPGSLCVYYGFQIRLFMAFSSMQTIKFLLLVPYFRLFFFFLRVLSNSYLFYFILFHYYPLEVCLFPNKRQKWSGSRWQERWGNTRRSRGMGNYNQDIFSEQKFILKNNALNMKKVRLKMLSLISLKQKTTLEKGSKV